MRAPELRDERFRAFVEESVRRIAGGVAHDLNNVLSVILTFTSFLEQEAPSAWKEDLATIREAALRGADLTKLLLVLGQRVVRTKTLDLGVVMTRMQNMISRAVGDQVEVSIRVAPDLWPVRADLASIEQIVLGLAAVGRPNEKLEIELDNTDLPAPAVTISIRGIGSIDDDQLAIVIGLVRQNGGTVHRNEDSIELRFPKELPPIPEQPEIPPPRSGFETVLVVDDDTSARSAAAVILRRRGHRVLEAASGTEAIATSERYRGSIHLLVTDTTMPKLSGYELAAHLTLARPNLRVLYLTDYAALEGTVPHLEKPFTPESLLNAVRTALAR